MNTAMGTAASKIFLGGNASKLLGVLHYVGLRGFSGMGTKTLSTHAGYTWDLTDFPCRYFRAQIYSWSSLQLDRGFKLQKLYKGMGNMYYLNTKPWYGALDPKPVPKP